MISPLTVAITLLAFFVLFQELEAFIVQPRMIASLGRKHLKVATPFKSTWQEDLDHILNVDTPCESRKELSKGMLKRLNEITADVAVAVKDRDVEKLAPKSSTYGKVLRKMNIFGNQLASDIIPNIFTKGVPKMVEEGPKIVNKLLETKPNEVVESGQKVFQSVKEIVQDPSMLQSTVDELKKELKNSVKSTPEGVQTVKYTVLEKADAIEIRHYPTYAVCTAPLNAPGGIFSSVDSPIEALVLSGGYRALSAYFSGSNKKGDHSVNLSHTAPVITDDTTISFVLPDHLLAGSAPAPNSDEVRLRNVAAQTVATIEFSGFATETEIRKQRALLEDHLISKGISYDSASFRVLQYNPLHTLPWVRRNEIVVDVSYSSKA